MTILIDPFVHSLLSSVVRVVLGTNKPLKLRKLLLLPDLHQITMETW